MNKINFIKIFIIIMSAIVLLTGCHSSSNETTIGIVVPIEHKAMDEIVAGFTETLQKEYPHPINFKVMNAQGDINLQRAIIQQMQNENDALIVPIGSAATEMSVTMVHSQPIVSVASVYTEEERQKQHPCNIAIVHDEIAPEKIIEFVHEVYPQIHNITLVHSSVDKIFPDVKKIVAAGQKLGIDVHPSMAPTLNDLYSVANAIPQNAQAILVLKDNLIVSGISTLEITAEKRGIPLITSDQGSVQNGAAFAIGVHEKQIGIEGAKLAAAILSGKASCSLPIVEMTHLTVFINKNSLTKEKQNDASILAAAKKLNYATEFVDQESK